LVNVVKVYNSSCVIKYLKFNVLRNIDEFVIKMREVKLKITKKIEQEKSEIR